MQLYKIFGYAGSIPFLALSVGLTIVSNPEWQYDLAIIQLCYAGMIASFLGGMHWAHALPRDHHAQIFTAMQPTILSLFLIIIALITDGFGVVFVLMALGFVGLYRLDISMLESEWLPEGYSAFRQRITIIVSAALLISAMSFVI